MHLIKLSNHNLLCDKFFLLLLQNILNLFYVRDESVMHKDRYILNITLYFKLGYT